MSAEVLGSLFREVAGVFSGRLRSAYPDLDVSGLMLDISLYLDHHELHGMTLEVQ